MTGQPMPSVVCGNEIAASPYPFDSTPDRPRRDDAHRPANPLERLSQIMRSNERLMDELATSRERIDRARAYLDAPGANARFGSLHLDRCRGKHSGILAQLRANRIEALALLASGGPGR